MYEAPDRYKRLISARLPGGESAGLAAREAEGESSPLRDVQLISRAQLAPFFAAANIIAAVILAANLWGAVPSEFVWPWVLAVAGVNLGAMQLARHHSITCVGRSGHRVPMWTLVTEVAVRGVLWLSLPVYFYPTLDPGTQVITASVMAGLGIGALGLVVIPPCATAWMVAFTLGVGGSLLLGRHTVPFQHQLSILFTMGVSITGVLTVARWAFHQLKTNADVGSQSESASLLLQEYEQRGVGWLWSVDADNRVTYISSRMSALLGKPAGQLLGHSFPALLGGHAELGRVLLEKQQFNALEMELPTARGSRWISIAGDPIVDTAGRFEGFRGVGSDITEIRQTQERLTSFRACPTAAASASCSAKRSVARRAAACRARSCSSTWTVSSRSTTPSATPKATPCFAPLPSGLSTKSATLAMWGAWVATNSRLSSPTRKAGRLSRTSPIASSRRSASLT